MRRRIVSIVEAAPAENVCPEAARYRRNIGKQGSGPGSNLLYPVRSSDCALFYLLGISVDYEVVNPQTHQIGHATATAKSLLSADGIRFTGDLRAVSDRIRLNETVLIHYREERIYTDELLRRRLQRLP